MKLIEKNYDRKSRGNHKGRENAQHPVGLNPITLRLVGQWLNHCATITSCRGLDLESLNLKGIILRGSTARAKVSHAKSDS